MNYRSRAYQRPPKLATVIIILFALAFGILQLAYNPSRTGLYILLLCAAASVAVAVLSAVIKRKTAAIVIPLLFFATYTASEFMLQNFTGLFIAHAAILLVSALYCNLSGFTVFTIITYAVNITLAVFDYPLTASWRSAEVIPAFELSFDWALLGCVTITLYLLVKNAANRQNIINESDTAIAKMLENTPNLTAMVDELNRVQFVSRSLLNFCGFEDMSLAEERPLLDLFNNINFKLLLSDALYSDAEYEEMRSIETDGETRWFKVSSDKLSGKSRGTLLIITDITDIMRAKLEAENAFRSKRDFLSNASYELRSSINSISGITVIGRSADTLERKDYALSQIEETSVQLLGTVNDILDISEIESNRFTLSMTQFNFDDMMQKISLNINPRAELKDISFSVYIDANIPHTLIGDETRLAQVITNLLINSVKFTPEGGNMRLVAKLVSNEGGVTVIGVEVKDNGVGISREMQDKIFTLAAQSNGSGRQYDGSGLGLVLSKRIVELMGGTIWVNSEVGNGSTFAFTIRMSRGRRAIDRESAKYDTGNPIFTGKRALVLDSASESSAYLAMITRAFGVSCDIAPNIKQAAESFARSGSYDLCFVSDLSNAAALLSNRYCAKAVLLASATEWQLAEADAKSIGVEDHLSRPLFRGNVYDVLTRAFSDSAMLEQKLFGQVGQFEGYTILLADDTEIHREIVIALLDTSGITVETARDGYEALKIFSANPSNYDLILMDVQMPEMNGLEATRAIRALHPPWAKSIPIIAMTTNVFREDVELCKEAGMDDHLGKPLNVEELLRKLHRYLTKEQPGGRRS